MKAFRYTGEMLAFLETEFKRLPIADLTEAFNARYGTNKNKVAIHTLITRKGFTCGRDGRFQNGGKPWNTGTKGLTSANKTSFKKGDIPFNVRPIGSERIDTKDGYILIKVAQENPHTGATTRYRHKHIAVYENEHGPIPSGHAVRLKDGDKTNCALDNLELITLAENAHLNRIGYSCLPDEFKPAMMAVAKVEVRMFKLNAKRDKEGA